MNKLEEKILPWVHVADKYNYTLDSEKEYIAKEIAKIALKLAEKAYNEGRAHQRDDKWSDFEDFKQEVL